MLRASSQAIEGLLATAVLIVLGIGCGQSSKRSHTLPPPMSAESHEAVSMEEAHTIQQELNLQLGTSVEARDTARNLGSYPPSKPFESCLKQYSSQAEACDHLAEKKPTAMNYEVCMYYINSVFQSCDTPKTALSAAKN